MPNVAVPVADYLKNVALFTAADASGVAWGERGLETEIISPLYNKADADAEAAREVAFLSGPLVEDVITVPDARRDLMHRTIEAVGDKLDYDAGVPVFVIGYAELDNGTTELIVLRSLAA